MSNLLKRHEFPNRKFMPLLRLHIVSVVQDIKISLNFVSFCMQGKKEYQEKLFLQF